MALNSEVFLVDAPHDVSVCLSSLHKDPGVRGHFVFQLSMELHTCMTDSWYMLQKYAHEPKLALNSEVFLFALNTSCELSFLVIST